MNKIKIKTMNDAKGILLYTWSQLLRILPPPPPPPPRKMLYPNLPQDVDTRASLMAAVIKRHGKVNPRGRGGELVVYHSHRVLLLKHALFCTNWFMIPVGKSCMVILMEKKRGSYHLPRSTVEVPPGMWYFYVATVQTDEAVHIERPVIQKA